MMILRTVKKRKDFYGEQNKRTILKKSKNVNDHPPPHLPEELIFDSILTKLPARSLALCSCASKLWYNSIYNDARFASSHFVQNQNRLSLVFNLLNVPEGDTEKVYIFSLEKGAVNDDYFSYISLLDFQLKNELVGYCNGLACVKVAPEHVGTVGAITVFNPIRGESLVLSYLAPGGYIHLCHGFGFDSSSHKYKAVIIFTSKGNDVFVCMVFTLGTNSWRKLTTTAAEISLPPGSSPPYSGRMVTRISKKRCPSASATLCGGDLLWRITNQVLEEDIINHDDNDNKIEMLLSFDLHNEKIQFVRLPAEYSDPNDR